MKGYLGFHRNDNVMSIHTFDTVVYASDDKFDLLEWIIKKTKELNNYLHIVNLIPDTDNKIPFTPICRYKNMYYTQQITFPYNNTYKTNKPLSKKDVANFIESSLQKFGG